MFRTAYWTLAAVVLVVVAGCSSQNTDGGVRDLELLTAETFDWCRQAIAFQPPPERWRRGRYNQGGKVGVEFVLSGGAGERIYVVEYYKVEDRAEREGHRTRYRIEDFIEEVRFDPARLPDVTDHHTEPLQPATIGGEPALRFDWEVQGRGRTYVGRDYYVLKDNCLFIASYMGLRQHRGIFDRVVETITFPEES